MRFAAVVVPVTFRVSAVAVPVTPRVWVVTVLVTEIPAKVGDQFPGCSACHLPDAASYSRTLLSWIVVPPPA